MKLYVIKGWDGNYESAESRKIAGPLKWYAARTSISGLGYVRMTQEKDAAQLFAAWNLILMIAANQNREDRGVLAHRGIPLTPDDMELVTRFPAKTFERALEFFSSDRIGWLEVKSLNSCNPPDDQRALGCAASQTAESGAIRQTMPDTVQEITEQEIIEQKGAAEAAVVFPIGLDTDAFRAAWGRYIEYRRKAKLKKLQPVSVQAQLEKLASWGEATSIQSINETIANAWQGLFEPKQGAFARQAAPAKEEIRIR
jgi:hypothetical protein